MPLKLIHSSDWQIGKVFRYVDNAAMGILQDARLRAISSLGELAVAHGVHHVVVAGDVYDMEAISTRSLNQPVERMRIFSGVQWHLLPGNHDPHRPNGIWDQLLRRGLPANVHVYLTPVPAILDGDGAVLLPAPLQNRRAIGDPTSYMDAAATPDGMLRVGLAHGTITGFGSDDSEVPNYISPDRPSKAGLAYLALGDWHGQREINERCWYSGTPETDAFDVSGGGLALLVDIEGRDAHPIITPLTTGHFVWLTLHQQLNSREDVDFLSAKLRTVADDLHRVLIHLTVEGALSLQDRRYFEEQIIDGVSAALCFLRVDDRHLFPRPTQEDLDQIDRGGFVRAAAEELKRRSEEGGDAERGIAAAALQRLYIEHMKLQAGQK